MTAYYNVLNILGDRMGRFPTTVVRLSGASMEGTDDGKAMAESIKRYLVSVFSIDPSRINTEGRIKPRIPSEQPGGTKELVLLRECDRRVSIWSESPEILMEYQTGPNAPLAPVEILAVQEAPVDSYVTFNVEGAKEAFSSWSLEVKDDKGTVQKFGPYTQVQLSIPGKSILGTRPEGDYKVTMVGQTKSGKTVRKETSVHMVLWKPSDREEGMRYSVIFEFNQSEAIALYEKYLTDIVTPKIPKDGTVIIHGHTDIIGDTATNMTLSLARANDVKGIIESALSKAGRTDVKFEVYGFGADQNMAPFENKFPEERFYNRTVIIDIIPPK
jgi:outer membrane protein OmpA-like peptidoglycan-associated protein